MKLKDTFVNKNNDIYIISQTRSEAVFVKYDWFICNHIGFRLCVNSITLLKTQVKSVW